jgi:hypothetical protein
VKLTITVTGMADIKRSLAGFSERRLNAAAATALTWTARDVRDGIRKELPQTFDRPTPFTLNQLTLKAATAAQPVAEVGFRERADFLVPQVKGGGRRQKPFERALIQAGHMPAGRFAVPGPGAPLDQYGNIPRRLLGEILSHLQAHTGTRAKRNLSTERRLRNAQKKIGGKYFVIDGSRKGLAPGIWRQGAAARDVRPMLLFVRPPQYSARFNFDGIARDIAQRRLGPNFARAFNESAARLAAKG